MAIEMQVDLTGNVAENAKKAAAALSANAASAKILKTELGSLEDKLVKASALGNTKQITKLEGEIKLYKKSLATLPPELEKNTTETATLGEAVKGLLGPYEKAAAIIGAMITGIAAAVVAMGALAISSSLLKDKLLATFSAMSGGKAAGAATVKMLDQVSDEMGVTRESIVDTAKQFEAMGITDLGALRNQIKATTAITAVMGEEGGAAYQKLIAKSQEAIDTGAKMKVSDKQIASFRQMGLNVEEIGAKMGMTGKQLEQALTKGTVDAKKFQDALGATARSKFGEALAEQALEPTKLWDKFKESISKLFDGVEVKPFLQSVQQLFGLFSSDKASGKAMKLGLTATFDAVFKSATKFVTWLRGAFLNIEAWVLKALIFMKPFVKQFDELDKKYGIVNKLTTGLKILGTIIGVYVLGNLLLLAAPFIAAAAEAVAFWGALTMVVGVLAGMADDLSAWSSGALSAAGDFVDGLATGIKNGALKVVQAAKDLAGGAVDAVTGLFKSHSPSLVMQNIGDSGFSGGLAAGISAGAPDVAASASKVSQVAVGTAGEQIPQVSAVPRAAAAASAAPVAGPGQGFKGTDGGSSGGGTENHFHFAPGAFKVDGAGKTAEGITEELVSLIFERVALEQGL
jgi:hypothetical protein